MKDNREKGSALTILTPVFNEALNLESFAERVAAVLFATDEADVRILFIDDGSTDNSWRIIQSLTARDPRFSGIRLSRNYGAHVALAAGLDRVSHEAKAVAILACDLQDPPETVLDFVREWRKGADVVWGKRRTRGDEGWRQQASKLLETLVRRFAMPRNSRFTTGSFLLIDRAVLECVRQFREHSRVTFALVAWAGFDQAVVEYDRKARMRGHTGWSFGRMIAAAYDLLIGFSPLPAKIITAVGFGLFGLSILLLGYLLIEWMLQDVQPGWTGIMAALTGFFGIQFVMMGVASEYLHRIFVESKNRPLYFVSAKTEAPRKTGD